MRRVTLYGKPDCPLCDVAEALLRNLRHELEFELEKLDIRSDPALLERYRDAVPVIAVDGRERLRGRIRSEDLRRALAGP